MIQVVRQFLHKERSMDMAQTTKNAIRKGFLDLLEQRPLDKISVVDIADHCGVNRNTFYYYYCDIYALVREVLETELDRVLNAPPLCTSWYQLVQRGGALRTRSSSVSSTSRTRA